MKIQKILLFSALLTIMSCSSAFAGTEDWDGQYNLDFGGQDTPVTHTATKVQFLFFSAGKCISLSKGTKLNGVEIKENVSLCTTQNIPTFTQELKKLGPLKSQKTVPGPTYHE